jgi:hypothetical protein
MQTSQQPVLFVVLAPAALHASFTGNVAIQAKQQQAAEAPAPTQPLHSPVPHAVQASGNLHIETWKDAQATARSFISNNIWRAPIAACALGGLMVVLFNLLSCIVLIR